MDVQTKVRIGYRYVRSYASILAELVNDGVLHLVRNELRVAELLGEHHRIDCKGHLVVHQSAPVNLLHLIVYIIGAACLEFLYWLKYPYSSMQLEISTIHHFLVAGE